MITHGTKRNKNCTEEIFHSDYGWLPSKHFYDLISNDDDPLEPGSETEERVRGESLDHFYKRDNHYSDMVKDDHLD